MKATTIELEHAFAKLQDLLVKYRRRIESNIMTVHDFYIFMTLHYRTPDFYC